jgi:hypothetical protein
MDHLTDAIIKVLNNNMFVFEIINKDLVILH